MRKSTYVLAFRVKDKYVFINSLTGAVNLVSREAAQQYFEGEVTPEVTPFLTHLTSEEEREKAQALCAFLKKNAVRCTDSTITVTYECNLRCPYCYEVWAKNPGMKRVTMNTYKVDKVYSALELLDRDCLRKRPIVLTGGEPLMEKNREVVEYILNEGEKRGYSFIILTNGVELDHFLPLLSSVDVQCIQITLDGPPSLHDQRRVFKRGRGTFSTIADNIEKARSHKIPLLIRTNVDPEILSRLEELARIFRERGWVGDPSMHFVFAYVCDQFLTPEKVGEGSAVYEKMMEVVKRPEYSFFKAIPFPKLLPVFDRSRTFWPAFWYCNAAAERYVFDPCGDIYPCRVMLGWKEQRIGTYVPALSFNENHSKWKNRTIFTVKGCEGCQMAPVCGGGCGYSSLLNRGDLYQPVCGLTESFITHYLEYLYDTRAVNLY